LCQGSITALNMAICTDNDLRVAAVQRLHAFDDAKARLTSDQQKTLAADQNGWAMSYAQSCGLHADVAPTLPLAPSVKECLAHAGQQRLAYLRSYGTPAASSQTTPAANPGSAASSAASPSTPGPGPSAVSSDTASAVQQVTEPPAQPAETLPMSAPPANSPSAPDAKPSTPAAATVSCTTASRASANPFGGDARIPAFGTLQGKTMAASVLLAWATVCLWVLAVFRNTRRQPR
jgi:hypothetical protein